MNFESLNKTILVSGASGLIGSALVRAWMPEPIHLVRLVRRKEHVREAEAGQAVLWNPSAEPPLSDLQLIRGVTAAVHLSGATVAGPRWTPAYKREIYNSRVQSTTALVNTLLQLAPLPEVLVCASAIGIYGNRAEEILDENSPPGEGFLANTCVAWEAATLAAEAAGIRVVHARFGVVLSPQGGALAKMLPLFRLGLGGPLGNGRQFMPWITLRDAVSILRYCIDEPAIRGAVNVVAPNPVTNAEFTRALGSALHRPAILPAPAFALRLAFGEMADQALLASDRVVPAKLLQNGFEFADPLLGPALESITSSSA